MMNNDTAPTTLLGPQAPGNTTPPVALTIDKQQKAEMLADEDPLLISQSLTYVTDDGSVLHSFQSAPFSLGKLTSEDYWRCYT